MAHGRNSSPGRRRHDPRLIRRLVQRHERDGLSYASLSATSGVPVGTLAWWAHRLRKPGGASPRESPADFVEVIASDAGLEVGGEFEITLPSGIQIRAPAAVDRGQLARLVQAILSC